MATPEHRPRRRGRTTLLIAVAAVLGVVAGTCTGFLVQANRAPDALPSLSQPAVAQAKDPAPEPLSAAQDRKVKVDGDLRKLLLRKPAGARAGIVEGSAGWLSLADYSARYEKPSSAFSYFIGDEFRRAAGVRWSEGTRDVEVVLVQFRQEDVLGASDAAENGVSYAEKPSGTESWGIPGTGDGMAYTHSAEDGEYSAEAHAWRGDVAMEIWIYDTKPVPRKVVMDLAERQMGRL
ncbi:hypothetical protein [Streptomyces sp. R08]|uniref:Lipoprotein n=1 Tax=Streptomyces sp. R08 TaxID=3238624 RepID=A0AB39MAW3_9ACTN